MAQLGSAVKDMMLATVMKEKWRKYLRDDPNFKDLICLHQDEHKPINTDIPSKWVYPKCEQEQLRKVTGDPYVSFLGCNRYPECKFTKSLKKKS